MSKAAAPVHEQLHEATTRAHDLAKRFAKQMKALSRVYVEIRGEQLEFEPEPLVGTEREALVMIESLRSALVEAVENKCRLMTDQTKAMATKKLLALRDQQQRLGREATKMFTALQIAEAEMNDHTVLTRGRQLRVDLVSKLNEMITLAGTPVTTPHIIVHAEKASVLRLVGSTGLSTLPQPHLEEPTVLPFGFSLAWALESSGTRNMDGTSVAFEIHTRPVKVPEDEDGAAESKQEEGEGAAAADAIAEWQLAGRTQETTATVSVVCRSLTPKMQRNSLPRESRWLRAINISRALRRERPDVVFVPNHRRVYSRRFSSSLLEDQRRQPL